MAYVRSQLIAQKIKCYFFICHDPSVLSYLMSVCVVCMFPHVCTHMCGGLQLSLGVFLDPSLPNLSKQGFSTEPTARHKASLARQLAQEVSCLCLLGAEIAAACHAHPAFMWVVGIPTCPASILTEGAISPPSPWM